MPLYRDKLSKDQKKIIRAVEELPIPEDIFNPTEDKDQAPITDEQKEELSKWELAELPRSAKSAASLLYFVDSARGITGKGADLPDIRIKEVRRYMSVYPRGTIIEATYRDGMVIDGQFKERWFTNYAKVIDWYGRSFDENIALHRTIQENFAAPPKAKLAPFQLIALCQDGKIRRLSMSNIKKVVDSSSSSTEPKSPEGTRKLR